EVGQARTAGGQLQGERPEDEDEPDEEQDVVAMPEGGPEPPDPGQKNRDEEGAEQEETAEPGDVERGLVQPEPLDLLHVEGRDPVAVVDDDLALLDLLGDGCDALGGR